LTARKREPAATSLGKNLNAVAVAHIAKTLDKQRFCGILFEWRGPANNVDDGRIMGEVLPQWTRKKRLPKGNLFGILLYANCND